MKILFNKQGNPLKVKDIKRNIDAFGESYNRTVQKIIDNSHSGLSQIVFKQNLAILMPNFKMTRAGPFKGVKYLDGSVRDPNGQIAACWTDIGNEVVQIRKFIDKKNRSRRARALVEISKKAREEVTSEIWKMFKKLVSLCMGEYTYGLVAASKILFAVLPEVALPIDNTQWRDVFKTIDYGDVIRLMAEEITEWENRVRKQLDFYDPQHSFTLPAIYNVMAMKARH